MKNNIFKINKPTILSAAFALVITGIMMFIAPVNASKETASSESESTPSSLATNKLSSIIVAGGCFWCVESDFELIDGVKQVTSGYINGSTENPTYKQVSSKKTGHFEVVKIDFDASVVSTKELVDYFWLTIDPTDDGGQFCDRGSPYKTGLFYTNQDQKNIFSESLEQIKQTKPFGADIVTPVLEAQTFYDAEDYHQDYYTKNPLRYKYYRNSCGRDKTIKRLWGKVASKKYH